MLYGSVSSEPDKNTLLHSSDVALQGKVDFVNNTYYYQNELIGPASYVLYDQTQVITPFGLLVRKGRVSSSTRLAIDWLTEPPWTAVFEFDLTYVGGEITTIIRTDDGSFNGTQILLQPQYGDVFVYDHGTSYRFVDAGTDTALLGVHRAAITTTLSELAVSVDGADFVAQFNANTIRSSLLQPVTTGGMYTQASGPGFFLRYIAWYSPKFDIQLPILSRIATPIAHTHLLDALSALVVSPVFLPARFFHLTGPKPYRVNPTVSNVVGVTSVTPSLDFISPSLAGALMIAKVFVSAPSQTITVSGAGWTMGQTHSDANALSSAWAWRYIDGIEAAPTFSWSTPAAAKADVLSFSNGAAQIPIGAKAVPKDGLVTPLAIGPIRATRDLSTFALMMFQGGSYVFPALGAWSIIHDDEDVTSGSDTTAVYSVFQLNDISAPVSEAATAAWHAYLIELLAVPPPKSRQPTFGGEGFLAVDAITPTQYGSALLGGLGSVNFHTCASWNPLDTAGAVAFSNGNKTLTHSAVAGFDATRAGDEFNRGMGKSSDKWYYEIYCVTPSQHFYGFADLTTTPLTTTYVGNFPNSFSFQNADTNYKSYTGVVFSGLPTNGSTYGFAVDMDNNKIYVSVDGVYINAGNPVSGVGAWAHGFTGILYPAITLFRASLAITANFGDSPFLYPVPSGYNPGWYY